MQQHLLDGDGINPELYKLLSRESKTTLRAVPLNFKVPDTIIYCGCASFWYYWSSDTNTLQRYPARALEKVTIYRRFTNKAFVGGGSTGIHGGEGDESQEEKRSTWAQAGGVSDDEGAAGEGSSSKGKASSVVALFIDTTSVNLDITYFTKETLKQFLFSEKRWYGVLQMSVAPRLDHVEMVQAMYSPVQTFAIRRVNRSKIYDGAVSPAMRCCTFDGPTYQCEEHYCLPHVTAIYKGLCTRFVEFFANMNPKHNVERLVAYFKQDKHETYWLLFTTSVRVAEVKDADRAAELYQHNQLKFLSSAAAAGPTGGLAASSSSPPPPLSSSSAPRDTSTPFSGGGGGGGGGGVHASEEGKRLWQKHLKKPVAKCNVDSSAGSIPLARIVRDGSGERGSSSFLNANSNNSNSNIAAATTSRPRPSTAGAASMRQQQGFDPNHVNTFPKEFKALRKKEARQMCNNSGASSVGGFSADLNQTAMGVSTSQQQQQQQREMSPSPTTASPTSNQPPPLSSEQQQQQRRQQRSASSASQNTNGPPRGSLASSHYQYNSSPTTGSTNSTYYRNLTKRMHAQERHNSVLECVEKVTDSFLKDGNDRLKTFGRMQPVALYMNDLGDENRNEKVLRQQKEKAEAAAEVQRQRRQTIAMLLQKGNQNKGGLASMEGEGNTPVRDDAALSPPQPIDSRRRPQSSGGVRRSSSSSFSTVPPPIDTLHMNYTQREALLSPQERRLRRERQAERLRMRPPSARLATPYYTCSADMLEEDDDGDDDADDKSTSDGGQRHGDEDDHGSGTQSRDIARFAKHKLKRTNRLNQQRDSIEQQTAEMNRQLAEIKRAGFAALTTTASMTSCHKSHMKPRDLSPLTSIVNSNKSRDAAATAGADEADTHHQHHAADDAAGGGEGGGEDGNSGDTTAAQISIIRQRLHMAREEQKAAKAAALAEQQKRDRVKGAAVSEAASGGGGVTANATTASDGSATAFDEVVALLSNNHQQRAVGVTGGTGGAPQPLFPPSASLAAGTFSAANGGPTPSADASTVALPVNNACALAAVPRHQPFTNPLDITRGALMIGKSHETVADALEAQSLSICAAVSDTLYPIAEAIKLMRRASQQRTVAGGGGGNASTSAGVAESNLKSLLDHAEMRIVVEEDPIPEGAGEWAASSPLSLSSPAAPTSTSASSPKRDSSVNFADDTAFLASSSHQQQQHQQHHGHKPSSSSSYQTYVDITHEHNLKRKSAEDEERRTRLVFTIDSGLLATMRHYMSSQAAWSEMKIKFEDETSVAAATAAALAAASSMAGPSMNASKSNNNGAASASVSQRPFFFKLDGDGAVGFAGDDDRILFGPPKRPLPPGLFHSEDDVKLLGMVRDLQALLDAIRKDDFVRHEKEVRGRERQGHSSSDDNATDNSTHIVIDADSNVKESIGTTFTLSSSPAAAAQQPPPFDWEVFRKRIERRRQLAARRQQREAFLLRNNAHHRSADESSLFLANATANGFMLKGNGAGEENTNTNNDTTVDVSARKEEGVAAHTLDDASLQKQQQNTKTLRPLLLAHMRRVFTHRYYTSHAGVEGEDSEDIDEDAMDAIDVAFKDRCLEALKEEEEEGAAAEVEAAKTKKAADLKASRKQQEKQHRRESSFGSRSQNDDTNDAAAEEDSGKEKETAAAAADVSVQLRGIPSPFKASTFTAAYFQSILTDVILEMKTSSKKGSTTMASNAKHSSGRTATNESKPLDPFAADSPHRSVLALQEAIGNYYPHQHYSQQQGGASAASPTTAATPSYFFPYKGMLSTTTPSTTMTALSSGRAGSVVAVADDGSSSPSSPSSPSSHRHASIVERIKQLKSSNPYHVASQKAEARKSVQLQQEEDEKKRSQRKSEAGDYDGNDYDVSPSADDKTSRMVKKATASVIDFPPSFELLPNPPFMSGVTIECCITYPFPAPSVFMLAAGQLQETLRAEVAAIRAMGQRRKAKILTSLLAGGGGSGGGGGVGGLRALAALAGAGGGGSHTAHNNASSENASDGDNRAVKSREAFTKKGGGPKKESSNSASGVGGSRSRSTSPLKSRGVGGGGSANSKQSSAFSSSTPPPSNSNDGLNSQGPLLKASSAPLAPPSPPHSHWLAAVMAARRHYFTRAFLTNTTGNSNSNANTGGAAAIINPQKDSNYTTATSVAAANASNKFAALIRSKETTGGDAIAALANKKKNAEYVNAAKGAAVRSESATPAVPSSAPQQHQHEETQEEGEVAAPPTAMERHEDGDEDAEAVRKEGPFDHTSHDVEGDDKKGQGDEAATSSAREEDEEEEAHTPPSSHSSSDREITTVKESRDQQPPSDHADKAEDDEPLGDFTTMEAEENDEYFKLDGEDDAFKVSPPPRPSSSPPPPPSSSQAPPPPSSSAPQQPTKKPDDDTPDWLAD